MTDPSGTIVTGAQVVATETQTYMRTEITTDAKGFYDFPTLAIGGVEIHVPGFKTFRKAEIVIDANSNIRVAVNLQLGATTEQCEVRSDAVQIETQSTKMAKRLSARARQPFP